jgi:hypothetical protein
MHDLIIIQVDYRSLNTDKKIPKLKKEKEIVLILII